LHVVCKGVGEPIVSAGIEKIERADRKRDQYEPLKTVAAVRVWDGRKMSLVWEKTGFRSAASVAVPIKVSEVVIGDSDGVVSIWDWSRDRVVAKWDVFEMPVVDVACSGSGRAIAATSLDVSPLAIWVDGKRVAVPRIPAGLQFSVDVDEKGRYVAAGGSRAIRVFELKRSDNQHREKR
jgi:hypothetical protein